MADDSPVAVTAGAGPGLGASLAHRFAAEGCSLGLFARTESYLADLAMDLDTEVVAVPTDVADPEEVRFAFDEVRDELGPVDVLVNHASGAVWTGLRDQSVEEFERAWRVAARGGFVCSQEAVSDMVDADGGTIVFTGATSSVRGRGGAVGFSSAKFAVRGLAQSMASELGPEGITVAHVVLDGQILPPEGSVDDEDAFLDPDDIADVVDREGTATMTHEVHVTNGHGDIEFL